MAQLHSGTPVIHTKPQPVPNSSTSEKSAQPQPVNIPPAANPVPPIYPGAETKSVEPRPLITPPMTPSGTQPIQKEPLSPVESTNTLQPNRPPRDQASRENRATAVSSDISNRTIYSSEKYNPNKTIITYGKVPVATTKKKVTSLSPAVSNRTIKPSNNNYTPGKTASTYKNVPSVSTNKKHTTTKSTAAKKSVAKKKPR